MKKRISLCLLTMLVMLALAVPAHADLLLEPDNFFYSRHRDQCTLHRRSYYTNGPDGFVTLWDAPNGTGVAAQYENGEHLYVYYLYQDWGYVFLDGGKGGWVSMDQTELIYDYISFEEEYGDQFRPYDGEFARCSGTSKVTFWPYPGAPKSNIVSWDTSFIRDLGDSSTFYGSCWHSVFTDEDGLTWGFISYQQMGWLCFDDPAGTDFPVRDIPQVELVPAQTPVMPAVSRVPYVLVAGVVAVTAGLLVVFYWKKKKT